MTAYRSASLTPPVAPPLWQRAVAAVVVCNSTQTRVRLRDTAADARHLISRGYAEGWHGHIQQRAQGA